MIRAQCWLVSVAGEIQAVVFQRVKYGQIRLLAAFFHFSDGCLGRYFSIISQIIGNALGVLELFELAEVLADAGGRELLLSGREGAPSPA